jgi:hypothetical protein
MYRVLPCHKITPVLTIRANIFDFPTVGENIYRGRIATNWPLTGRTGEGEEQV